MCVVDRMYNLLLGTAKHMVELWKSLDLINSKCYNDIQTKVNSHVCPMMWAGFHQKFLLLSQDLQVNSGKAGQCIFLYLL